MKLCILIAAAGQSLRMGFPKALLPIQGLPAAIYLATQIPKNCVEKIFMTLPEDLFLDGGFKFILNSYLVETKINIFPHLGYSGSVKSIINEIYDEFDGIIITTIDSPFAKPALFGAIKALACLYSSQKTIVVPHFFALPGHPVYFSRHFFAALKHAHDVGGLRGVINLHENKKFVRKFHFPCARILANLNTPADLASWWHHVHANFERKTLIGDTADI